MVNQLVLRELNEHDEAAFLAGLKDWEGEDLTWYSFEWGPGVTYSGMIKRLAERKQGLNIPAEHVPSTMLYAFVNGEIVGRISIRHKLNEQLLKRGGHIGYAVSPRHRKKGYATEIVRQCLPHLRALKINPILITCAEDNLPSRKIIEGIGGKVENRIWDDEDEEWILRFWATI